MIGKEVKILSREYDFLKQCGYFYVLTVNNGCPAGRPFGAVMEYCGKLYVATHDGNEAHKQLRNNGNVQIIAKKEGTREWLRITGDAAECDDISIKQIMLDECPALLKHYPSADFEHYLLFEIDVLQSEFK